MRDSGTVDGESTVLYKLLLLLVEDYRLYIEITESYGIHYMQYNVHVQNGHSTPFFYMYMYVSLYYSPPAGTQTMLTFPMTFDLEKLVMVAYHGKATPTECLEEGEGRDVGNCSLRRKLFGQPERQVCVCVWGPPGRYTYSQTVHVTVCP